MKALGTDKDLERLARQVRREGGQVLITRSNHLTWIMPDGAVIRTGLTMHQRSVRNSQRRIERALTTAR